MTHHSKRHISARDALRTILNISMYILFGFIALILCVMLIINLFTKPSHDRDWNIDQAILPSVRFDSENPDIVTISDIRNFRYSSTTAYEIAYYDKTFNLQNLEKVWYIVEPFSGIPGSAHTMLSFEFIHPETDTSSTSTSARDFVSISVEIRKEKGESFHPIKGLFNQYEIMYVIADEEDVVKLRSNYRKDLVYMYPVRTDKEKARALLTSMLTATQALHDTPEFYNTITNTCTTNIVSHVNKVTPGRVPWLNLAVLFPASSDKLALSLGLLDTNLPLEEARKKFLINERALEFNGTETLKDFSIRVREF
ncbi:MAG: hypothetical protein RIQ72_24 [Candidatus Parcubacteria bacterium]